MLQIGNASKVSLWTIFLKGEQHAHQVVFNDRGFVHGVAGHGGRFAEPLQPLLS
jgi:hypothetical protein